VGEESCEREVGYRGSEIQHRELWLGKAVLIFGKGMAELGILLYSVSNFGVFDMDT
jgi:hypothetical protein